MVMYLENAGEITQKVFGNDVPKGGKVEVKDEALIAFMIRRRGFKRVQANASKGKDV